MKSNFSACLEITLRHEGGYVNDPQDPGGETKYGISKRSHPKEDIKGMTVKRAGEIYRSEYWSPLSGDSLPAGLDLAAFDAGVNSGISRGAKWLQSALGAPADGKIGPNTIARANAMSEAAQREVIRIACRERLRFLQGLKTWGRFGKGWTRRVNEIEAAALGMVGTVSQQKKNPTGNAVFVTGLVAAVFTAVASFFEEIKAAITSLFGG